MEKFNKIFAIAIAAILGVVIGVMGTTIINQNNEIETLQTQTTTIVEAPTTTVEEPKKNQFIDDEYSKELAYNSQTNNW